MSLGTLLWRLERRLLARRAARAPLQSLAAALYDGMPDARRVLAWSIELGLVQRARRAAAQTGALSIPTALQLAWLEGDLTRFDALAADAATPQALAEAGHAAQNKCLATLAQRSPERALAIVRAMPRAPACAPAVALRAGDAGAARAWRRSGRWQRHADYHLIDANLADTPAGKLQHLNAYLARHGLTPLRLLDPARPPAVGNLAAAAATPAGSAPVSVIVPAHDNAAHIGAAIRSLLQQTAAPAEILVIDDASQDDTAAVVAAIAQQHASLRLVRLPSNRGAYVARNLGLMLARAEFVAFHDADDYAHPERLQRATQPLRDDPQLHATSSRCVRLADDGVFGEARTWPLTRWTPISLLARREVALRVAGLFEPVRFGADSEYTARLRLLLGERHHRLVAEPLALFGQRVGSLTTGGGAAFDPQGRSTARIRYQEEWTERHLAHLLGQGALHRAADEDLLALLRQV